jgi:phosphoglycolate phosphatase-like HAD superfamily hydrolase
MIRLVLFDIDGTLILTGGAGMKAFAEAFADEFDLPNATESMDFAGRTDRGLACQIFRANHIPPTESNFQRFTEAYTQRLANHLPADNTQPLTGVVELLDAIEAMTAPPTLGLLTGNLPIGAELKLIHYNLWHRFEFGAFGDSTENRNEIARTALESARNQFPNLNPSEILIIGDTPADIHCAQTIGAQVLAVATGNFTEAELAAHQPTYLAPNLTGVTPDFFGA